VAKRTSLDFEGPAPKLAASGLSTMKNNPLEAS
jgi:hypothetical protein